MPHAIEVAASGRSTCRACGQKIAKGELRLGERLPNPFGDGDMTLWFHPRCGAYARPEPFLEALESLTGELDDRDVLEPAARVGLEHRRLPRIRHAERASTGRARCRSCRELIGKGEWRLPLQYYEEGQFSASGFIHVRCARPYLGTSAIVERVRHFAPDLEPGDIDEIGDQLALDGTKPEGE